jgi:hypothetical protein
MTPARPLALSTWALANRMNPAALRMADAFYAQPEHRPELVVFFRHPTFLRPYNPMQQHFAAWYESVAVVKTPVGELDVYRRR